MGRLIVAACAVATVLVACDGAEVREASYLAKGRQYLAAHNFAKAQLEFRNALQLDPNDPEACFLAGQVAERLGNIREAVQMYQTAIQVDSKHVGARAQLAKLYVLGGAPDKAMELLEPGLAIAPDDPDLLTSRGAARERSGDKLGARADAEKAVRVAPRNENAVALLASIYDQAGETARAIDLVSKAVSVPDGSVDLRLVLVQLYLNAGRRPEAVQEMQRVIAVEPKTLVHRFRLAQVLLLDKNIDGAEAALRAAIAQLPDSAEAKLALASLLASYRSYDVAGAELRRLSAASPDDYQLRLGLGQFYESHNQVPEASAVYRQIIKDDGTGPNGLIARNRLANADLASNQLDAAASLLNEVLSENPRDNDALVSRANLSLARGNVDAAITDLRAVQRDQPNSIALQRELARAYLKNDDPILAEETVRAAVQRSPNNPDLRLDLARLLVRTGRADQALPILEKLAASQPADVGALEELFDVQMARKDFTGARRAAGMVQAANPELPVGSYLSGLAELADGKLDAAREAFEHALTTAPNAVEPLTALVRVDLAQQRPEEAIGRLDKIIAQFPSDPLARNLKGEVLVGLQRNDAAIESFREAIRLSPSWIAPYRNVAAAELAAGRNDDAIRTLQQGIKASNSAVALEAYLADLYERLGRVDEAIAHYEDMVKRDTDSSVAANNLAMLLVTYRTDKPSLDRARALAERFASSRNPALMDTWGWVLFKRGEIAPATSALQKAVDNSPQAPVLRYHLAMAQLKAGARDTARSNLEQALKSGTAFSGSDEARRTLSELTP